MIYKYGTLTDEQISSLTNFMRKQIYFLLLITDPKTQNQYVNVNVENAFDNVLTKFGGLYSAMDEPRIIYNVIGAIEAALIDYKSNLYTSDSYKNSKCRKLILDAGNEIMRLN